MQIIETRRGENPWAFAKRPGFKGEASGLYFHYFHTKAEAIKSQQYAKRKGKYAGEVEYRPGECYTLGEIVF